MLLCDQTESGSVSDLFISLTKVQLPLKSASEENT